MDPVAAVPVPSCPPACPPPPDPFLWSTGVGFDVGVEAAAASRTFGLLGRKETSVKTFQHKTLQAFQSAG